MIKLKKSWCEVCQFEAQAETFEELLKIWDKHIKTQEHLSNVMKYLQYDLGALTIDEIPKKLKERLGWPKNFSTPSLYFFGNYDYI